MPAFVYMVRCSDGSYYIGSTRASLEQRISQHNTGHFGGYTAKRRPVTLVFHQEFQRITDAIAAERQLKGLEPRQEGSTDPRRLRYHQGARGWLDKTGGESPASGSSTRACGARSG
ncbi:MAG TPA: GIY-YIG nuclease family protein [Stellaceae bacterium]|jgi:predicted GIY-YIG superfamily endonuclease|nr:GIY-YIG nuclease family protein [Stellaceae bacterium]